MRFKASIQNISTFTKFTASLASLGPVAWVKLDESEVRFTVIPEQGSQVWAVLSIDTIFDQYNIQSAANNVINLEVPLVPLQRALKSALSATSASIRLTKKDNIPLLSLTIITNSLSSTTHSVYGGSGTANDGFGFGEGVHGSDGQGLRERETVVTQDVPIKVLSPLSVEGIHEPRSRDPDVHILLPPLMQLKNISDRFTRLALAARTNVTSGVTSMSSSGPRLELAANMHGCLKISIRTDAMNISSVWTGLSNPELDPSQIEGGEEGIRHHPSTKMKELGTADGRSEEGWASVRIDGRDWGKVMSVGRLGGRVIACFCHDHALILYVYLPNDEDGRDGSVLTYYVASYSE
ncbi:uncharacterized protein K452DRAFT_294732 [Aplosporella prunicola CBS 121167]|uniref:Checkpoint protein n=1 Tax=Aplosporella prunicola CBS 121167 TaxID=1176127 RepID=A0A6A6BTG9_9PEZI|nr:uncharacterized protein K452DRAFT_294732 [Aplosporella prunicola CBS 121167]KAF2146127.1 hypothetical protein K452DRAFT_294732 [Aplosporella prunicola CBS 121167]